MNNFSDQNFIDKLKNKDREALSLLVDAYTDHLYKAGLGSGLSVEMAKDLTANTWTTFIEVIPRFQGRSHIRTFLFGIFYNKLSELRRSNLKFSKTDPIEQTLESSFSEDGHWSNSWSEPEKRLQSTEVLSIINDCLEHLPLIQKSAFYMKFIQEEDSSIICEALEISNVNLRQLIFRAKNRIRNCVDNSLSS